MPTLSPAHKRLLALAERQQDGHLSAARGTVLRQFQGVALADAQAALERALSLPRGQRAGAVRDVLSLTAEAARVTRTPPGDLLGVIRRAVDGRVLNTQDLALLSDPALVFGDTRELQARAVDRQRRDMNGYWAAEAERFRNDASATVREAIRRGLDPEKAADLLQERLGVHRSRAVLIAADQLLTAQARSEIALLKAAGVREFSWQTRLDSRVRSDHAALQGRVFTWRSAPFLPGSPVRCRCRATVPPP